MKFNTNGIQESGIKRLLVYFFWDAEGVVDDYIPYALKSLAEYSTEILVVINGKVDNEGYRKLKSCSNKVLTRDNVGLDAWAYKAAFEHLGYDYLETFDEVLVTNFTLYGPFFPLNDLFNRMDATPCDFWGLAGYNQKVEDKAEVDHLQSFFVSYRKSLVKTKDFRTYWDQLPEIKNYTDSVNLHELSQTPYFTKRGYTFATWISQKKYSHISPANFIITCADRLLVEDKCSFLKRRALFFSNGNFEPGVTIDKIEHISNFIKVHTNYDISMLLENIERTQKQSDQAKTNVLRDGPSTSLSTTNNSRVFSKSKYYRKKIKSWIHPSKRARRHLKSLIDNINSTSNNAPAPHITHADIESDNYLWNRYLDCFRLVKPDARRLDLWVPRHQHVGRYTYAAPDTHIQSVGTVIGSFCSIGQRVVIGHGNHPKEFLSSSPYFYFDELGFKSEDMPTYDKFWYIEPIIIGNDVWIGDGAWIANGVTIGDGAIIGARAVVTKDVPPYSIVAGSPARIIRYRFDESTIKRLLKSEWWDLSDDVLRQVPFDDINEALNFIDSISEDIIDGAISTAIR